LPTIENHFHRPPKQRFWVICMVISLQAKPCQHHSSCDRFGDRFPPSQNSGYAFLRRILSTSLNHPQEGANNQILVGIATDSPATWTKARKQNPASSLGPHPVEQNGTSCIIARGPPLVRFIASLAESEGVVSCGFGSYFVDVRTATNTHKVFLNNFQGSTSTSGSLSRFCPWFRD